MFYKKKGKAHNTVFPAELEKEGQIAQHHCF
jgi:hypothetical protein